MAKVRPTLTSKSRDNVLEYYDRSHRYKLNGEFIRSMTAVGKGYPIPYNLVKWQVEKGPAEATRLMKEGGYVGTVVHDYIYRKRMGMKDFSDLKEKTIGHKLESQIRMGLQSADLWLAHTSNKLEKAEVICASPTLGVAGKFDELASKDGIMGVTDYKTSGSLSVTHFQQTAGYRRLIKEWFDIDTHWLELVHIKKDDIGFHEVVIDKEGLIYDGLRVIEDKDMFDDMTGQFERNIPTHAYLEKYKDFWKVIN